MGNWGSKKSKSKTDASQAPRRHAKTLSTEEEKQGRVEGAGHSHSGFRCPVLACVYICSKIWACIDSIFSQQCFLASCCVCMPCVCTGKKALVMRSNELVSYKRHSQKTPSMLGDTGQWKVASWYVILTGKGKKAHCCQVFGRRRNKQVVDETSMVVNLFCMMLWCRRKISRCKLWGVVNEVSVLGYQW